MQLPVLNMAGEQTGEVELNDAIFAAQINRGLMHQALMRQLANARQGTHKTKTRGEVRGGGRKPWRQKGTGRARQGSTTAPQWIGGGIVFGPRPRSYDKKMPQKMRQAALRSALSVKAGDQQLVVVNVAMEGPKTKEMVKALNAWGLVGKSTLLVLGEHNSPVETSARNLPTVKTLLSANLNIQDLLGYDTVVLSTSAVDHIHAWLGRPEIVEQEA